MKQQLKLKNITAHKSEDSLELDFKFYFNKDEYETQTLFISDFVGDKPSDIAKSLQKWADEFKKVDDHKSET